MNPVPPFLVALFLIPFAQKFLRLSEQLPVWQERLRIGRIVVFVACGIEMLTDGNYISPLVFFLSVLLVAAPAYLLKDENPNARLLLWMIGPAAVVLLADNLFEFWTPKFYKSNEGFFESSKALALIGSAIAGIIARKQQKVFEKTLAEQETRIKVEEENNKILETKKLSLEYQVSERTVELTKQKQELERALTELKAAQSQLIQSEKLASLGELTAGIAHEIQNPLNFVTNFSELSVELARELKEERLKPSSERDKTVENELLDDLIQNQEKINYHGKRASSIVKGMLEHSRNSKGERVLTDISQLADEYLRLSYHGMRAKDTRFNSDYELIAEPYLPLINAVPQDIGRVLLNLINNAFQAVSQPNLQGFESPTSLDTAVSKVIVSTNYIDGHIVVRVQDNGVGMSESTKVKIFEPFFTTKPTGEGTGLGLSLSYDIITKGYGGTIDVESTEGVGTTFTIKLPVY